MKKIHLRILLIGGMFSSITQDGLAVLYADEKDSKGKKIDRFQKKLNKETQQPEYVNDPPEWNVHESIERFFVIETDSNADEKLIAKQFVAAFEQYYNNGVAVEDWNIVEEKPE